MASSSPPARATPLTPSTPPTPGVIRGNPSTPDMAKSATIQRRSSLQESTNGKTCHWESKTSKAPRPTAATRGDISSQYIFLTQNRKEYRDINNTSDIAKTHASSLKKGISTSRNVNPLMPQYRYPS